MEPEAKDSPVLHSFNGMNKSLLQRNTVIIFVIMLFLGVGSGYLLSLQNKNVSSTTNEAGGSGASAGKGTIVGSDDLKTFKDSVEGVLKKGGKEDEGQYHLERPGGESQFVYLTSSLIDLSQFVGKKVKVNGETQKAQKVGWLMDVGRLEVLE